MPTCAACSTTRSWAARPSWCWAAGSNLVLTRDPEAVVLRVAVAGRRLVAETDDAWIVECGAGETWHDVVAWTLDNGWPAWRTWR